MHDIGSLTFTLTSLLPRASYGDKFTVTVMRSEEGEEEQHSVLDLTSKIVDFLVVEQESGLPDYLFILSEEEIVCLDLATQGWPVVKAPYMQVLPLTLPGLALLLLLLLLPLLLHTYRASTVAPSPP